MTPWKIDRVSASPLGYAALKPRRGKKRNPLSDRSLIAGFGRRLFTQTTSHSLKSGSALLAPRQGQQHLSFVILDLSFVIASCHAILTMTNGKCSVRLFILRMLSRVLHHP